MADLVSTVREWMRGNKWDLDGLKVGEDGKAQLNYKSSGEGDTYDAFLDIDENKQWIELFHYCPSKIPERHRRVVTELLALANARIHLGSLDLLNSDGRVRFRSGVDLEGGQLGAKMLENMEQMGCMCLDKYYPAVMAVAFAGQTPEHAFANVWGEEVTNRPKPEWLENDDEPPEWDRFPGTQCLQRWVGEIKSALAAELSAEDWELLGHGLILASDNLERAKLMLQRVAVDAGLQFATIPAESVLDLPLGGADPFRSMAPALVFLEPGEWMLSIKEDDAGSEQAHRVEGFRDRLIEKLKAFDHEHPVMFAVAAYEIEDVDKSLRSVGVFDRRFSVAPPSMEFQGNEFIDKIGREVCGSTLFESPSKVGKLISDHESERTRAIAAQAMRRLAKREKRTVEFIDLINFATRGTVETDEIPQDSDVVRKQVAYHEAGHALVAMIDSGGRNIPEYSTIVASGTFKGVVVESMGYHHSHDEQKTYRDFLHNVRICIAGRAGEHILVGAEHVSTGAGSDLESATRHCHHVFARCGFAPGMDDASAATNLAVICDEPSAAESAHVEDMTRRFLAEEYRNVFEMLKANRSLLDSIADRLMWDPIVDQRELADLMQKHPKTS
jgi:hypothetical protein